MEWINVKDRLPENGKPFLYYTVNGKVMVCANNRHTDNWFINKYGITHWMPLPEPPK